MSKYYLWLREAKTGPYSAEAIRRMLRQWQITGETLWCEEGGVDEWARVKDCAVFNIPVPAEAAKDVSPTRPGADADTITERGRQFVSAAKWLALLAAVVVVFSLLAAAGVFTGTSEQPPSPRGGLLFAAGCLALATWIYLIGQVVLIRAAIERWGNSGR